MFIERFFLKRLLLNTEDSEKQSKSDWVLRLLLGDEGKKSNQKRIDNGLVKIF